MTSVSPSTPTDDAPPLMHGFGDVPARFEIRPGAFVESGDGAVGRVHHVIVGPGRDALLGVVVRTGTAPRQDVLLPIDTVIDANDEVVRVDLTELEMNTLPRFDEHAYVKAPTGWRDSAGRRQPGALLRVPTTADVSGLQHASLLNHNVAIAVAVRQNGQQAVCRDGEVEGLDLLLVDPPEPLPDYRPDTEVIADIADALWNGDRLPPEDLDNIMVRVDGGIVEIRGVTTTEGARTRIEQVVWKAPGVQGVRDLATSLEALAAASVEGDSGA